jgi:bifunctional UDP-N-acetylglucosamine pyrophosphorylase/glucosamine-1-phosphate N-acetyltransferase
VREINAGIYVVQSAFLRRALQQVQAKNAQRELYLTDLVAMAVAEGEEVAVVATPPDEVLGVNDRVDLATAEAILRAASTKSTCVLASPCAILRPPTSRTKCSWPATPSSLVQAWSLRGKTRIGSGLSD